MLAVIIEAIAEIGPSFIAPDETNPHGWGLNVPAMPDSFVQAPNFYLIGEFNLLGSWSEIGVIATVLLVFTLLLADFFDTMGTMVAIGAEAELLDEEGKPPRTQQILVVDSLAAAAGGAASRLEQHVVHRVGVRRRRGRADRAGVRGDRRGCSC